MTKNPHCPVNRCQTARPHADDFLVKAMLAYTDHPQVYLHWVKKALIELRESMVDDHSKGRLISWLSRIRLVQELYIRTLYLLFVAAPDEVPHVLSGEFPNSFSYIYGRVDDEILLGQGILNKRVGDKVLGEVVPMKYLNIGAHVGYPMLLVMDNEEAQSEIKDYLEKYLDAYLENIQVIGTLFVDGVDRGTIKSKTIALHNSQASLH